jgi:hypothetical protein
VYGRDYEGKTLNFEPSGGLTNASLIMQDKQTNTYWSLMKGEAMAGELEGQNLETLPVGEKATWKDWREKHPETKVLSINSMQDGPNPYQSYFANAKGFRDLEAKDDRLDTKTPIFAFCSGDKKIAVAYKDVVDGMTFTLPDGKYAFLFRGKDDPLFRSTSAFVSEKQFENQNGIWFESASENKFDVRTRSFKNEVIKLIGFDTFWYNWSLNNPETEIMARDAK